MAMAFAILQGLGAPAEVSSVRLDASGPRVVAAVGCKVTDLTPLVKSCEADAAGPKRFAPYLRLYLGGNPLSDAAKKDQIAALKKIGVRVFEE